MHISSILVRTKPEWQEEVERDLTSRQGFDVHHTDNQGKIVATLEGEDSNSCAEQVSQLQQSKQILSVDMINYYFSVDENEFEFDDDEVKKIIEQKQITT